MRPSEPAWALALARETAKRSTCLRRHVGAVLVDQDGYVIATGYNGAPRGSAHCRTCRREDLAVKPGERYELCRSVHAEPNALLQAGKAARDATLYLCTLLPESGLVLENWPCAMCARLIVNAQVRSVVVATGTGFAIREPHAIQAGYEGGIHPVCNSR
jgi:dCMP deaminase